MIWTMCLRERGNVPFPFYFHHMGNNGYVSGFTDRLSLSRAVWKHHSSGKCLGTKTWKKNLRNDKGRKIAEVNLLSVNNQIKMWHFRLRKLSIMHVLPDNCWGIQELISNFLCAAGHRGRLCCTLLCSLIMKWHFGGPGLHSTLRAPK